MNMYMLNKIGKFLIDNNLSIFTFPNIETGDRFWSFHQPSVEPSTKGRTLAEVLEKEGLLDQITRL
jgi:hypothetical protein